MNLTDHPFGGYLRSPPTPVQAFFAYGLFIRDVQFHPCPELFIKLPRATKANSHKVTEENASSVTMA
jgi:hypothetical protein